MDKKNELTPIQELTAGVAGDVLGICAGGLVGGIALGIVENIPGVGKPLKVLLKLGAYGLDIVTALKVREAGTETVEGMLRTVNVVKGIFQKKPVAMTEEVEAEAEVK